MASKASDVKDLSLADQGRGRIEWALQEMPVMRSWLSSVEYRAVIFAQEDTPVAYAPYREDPDEIYLRQFFVVRALRRHGIGRTAMQSMLADIWPSTKRRTVSVLVQNASGVAFWRAVGYQDYALTLEIMPSAP
jgi:predicted acetyltransferase